MRIHNRLLIGAATVFAVAATTAATFGPAASSWAAGYGDDEDTAQVNDNFDVQARHIAPNRDYTVFLLEQAGAPFGAAEYIGDLSTNSQGTGHAELRLIVQEAFSSTLVDGKRVRVDLNRVGMWFADPKDDEFCLPGSGATPFDGDNEAGVQAFNSANTVALPAP